MSRAVFVYLWMELQLGRRGSRRFFGDEGEDGQRPLGVMVWNHSLLHCIAGGRRPCNSGRQLAVQRRCSSLRYKPRPIHYYSQATSPPAQTPPKNSLARRPTEISWWGCSPKQEGIKQISPPLLFGLFFFFFFSSDQKVLHEAATTFTSTNGVELPGVLFRTPRFGDRYSLIGSFTPFSSVGDEVLIDWRHSHTHPFSQVIVYASWV